MKATNTTEKLGEVIKERGMHGRCDSSAHPGALEDEWTLIPWDPRQQGHWSCFDSSGSFHLAPFQQVTTQGFWRHCHVHVVVSGDYNQVEVTALFVFEVDLASEKPWLLPREVALAV